MELELAGDSTRKTAYFLYSIYPGLILCLPFFYIDIRLGFAAIMVNCLLFIIIATYLTKNEFRTLKIKDNTFILEQGSIFKYRSRHIEFSISDIKDIQVYSKFFESGIKIFLFNGQQIKIKFEHIGKLYTPHFSIIKGPDDLKKKVEDISNQTSKERKSIFPSHYSNIYKDYFLKHVTIW